MLKSKSLCLFLTVGVISVGFLVKSHSAHAASASANISQSVITALSIAKVSDLNFGEAPQGDAAKTVAPGSDDNTNNASFNVAGEKGRSYTISLPTDGSTTITTGDGSTDKVIHVDQFKSFPENTGQLSADTGSSLLLVGATRAALSQTQTPGAYAGQFAVTVVY